MSDRLARAAVLPRCAHVEGPRPLVGPVVAHGLPAHRPDFFASSFLAAQDGRQKPAHPDEFLVHEQGADKAPPPRVVTSPSIFEDSVVSILFFAVGLVGWIALAVAVIILERRMPPKAS